MVYCSSMAEDNARELFTWCIPQGTAVATESLGCVITGGTKGFGFALAQVHTIAGKLRLCCRQRTQFSTSSSLSSATYMTVQRVKAMACAFDHTRNWRLAATML
jgi:hypothetical protein